MHIALQSLFLSLSPLSPLPPPPPSLPLSPPSLSLFLSPSSSLPSLFLPTPVLSHSSIRVQSLDCGEEPSAWLSKVLNRHCRLSRQNPLYQRTSKSTTQDGKRDTALSLSNEAQYLFISDASVKQLLGDMRQSCMDVDDELTVVSLTERFRPNLVLSAGVGVSPYAEELWEMVRIGKAQFKVS